MKKILLFTLLIIVIPYLIVSFFIKDEEIKFKYVSNMHVRVKSEKTNEITIVPFEQYIVGVLAGEMPVSFDIEALKAQAVAARSYVMRKMSTNKDKDYDVVDTVMNQVYLDDNYLKKVWKDDYTSKINKIKKAVLETKGEYLEYDGKVVEAFFFSTSTGKTENSEEVFVSKVPYLRSVDSHWDAEVSPVFNDSFQFSLSDFYTKLNLPYNNNITTKIISKTTGGRIKQIEINDKIFTGNDVMSKLSLRSNCFTIEQIKNNVMIKTKGYGHGVGMSQYGAEAMAKRGYKYDEILKHYYLGVKIQKI